MELFLKLLKYTIGTTIVIYIVVDPISLVLADDNLSMRVNFDPIDEAADISFFAEYLSEDIITSIKTTSYFSEFSQYFTNMEMMLPSVFDVVRNQAFNIEALAEIESQKHLLNLSERIILDWLKEGVKLTNIYPDCTMLGYFTSIQSKYHSNELHSSEYQEYLKYEQIFNKPYHNVFRSVIKGIKDNWILEHNELLSPKEIDVVERVLGKYKEEYQKSIDLF